MPYRYGRDWHGVLRKPIQEITEAQARKRFAAGPSFSVSKVSTADAKVVPEFTLQINPDGFYLGVAFYDEFGSEVRAYHFAEQPERPEELFLTGVTVRVYPDGQDRWLDLHQAAAHTTFTFRPNGWARSRLVVQGQDEARVQEFTGVDVSAHWVDRPEFGDWDRFGVAREPALQDDAPAG
ncbi:hypothetical protein ACI3EY_05485 [Ornithinimicrobium sp. LYQ92]|uniref:hypothetical protein n=1 Tax=Serinicoccus sp. LYQ92 TaxID=3378798 RepID=UPI0038533B82